MPSTSSLPRRFTRLAWLLVAASTALLFWSIDMTGWGFAVDGLTRIMAVIVTTISALVHSFARRYMAGDRRIEPFYIRLFGLTLVVLFMTAADHAALFAILWLAMGWILSTLIGHVQDWPAARGAERLARRSFLGGSAALVAALALLVVQTGTWSITGIVAAVPGLAPSTQIGSGLLLLTAAMVQSALVPFQTWLLSSMTAPTPVSAFMHAGIVNAGGILLTRFAPVLVETDVVLQMVFVIGAVSALLGQAWMMVQTDVKRQLGCSTVAQMGFMVLQCGLGFFAAAITHLILHGFYKAYFFLAAGSGVRSTRPPGEGPSASVAGTLLSVAAAVAGGALFAWLTGKSILTVDGGTVLTVFVVFAVLHATHTVIDRTSLSPLARTLVVPVLVITSIGAYAGVYLGISALLSDLPGTATTVAFSPVHAGTIAVFGAAYLTVERGWHRSFQSLYVWLVNSSQPAASALTTRREQYPS